MKILIIGQIHFGAKMGHTAQTHNGINSKKNQSASERPTFCEDVNCECGCKVTKTAAAVWFDGEPPALCSIME